MDENKARKTNKTLRHQRFTTFILSLPVLVFVVMSLHNKAAERPAAVSEEPAVAQAGASLPSSAPSAVPQQSADTVWIDVRTPQEFDGGHLPGAINLPVDGFAQTFPTLGLSRDAVVALYCRSGGRAGRALAIARELGYAKAYNAGGYEALIRD